MLEAALPKPAHIATSDGGAVLALALHCLMVKEGFTVVDQSGRKKHSVYCPPSDWNGIYLDQWVLVYTKDGYAHRFVLHCSLQVTTKRMFIHASEEGNQNNVCVLGLQLDNYVPDPTILKSNSWEDVVQNQVKLSELFAAHITQPLTAQAEELVLLPPQQDEAPAPRESSTSVGLLPLQLAEWLGQHQHTAVAITLGMVLVGSFVVWRAAKTRS